ncbi:MAG: hypothetical protein V8R80_03005 [Eubacterium sp.]
MTSHSLQQENFISTVNGKNYGVPFNNGAVIGAWRNDTPGEAGYKASDLNDIDWNKFIEIGKDVKAKTGKYMLSRDRQILRIPS